MGANASTPTGGSARAGGGGGQLDHYQLLGVEYTASAEEIKKAFRKTALREHPDKNPTDVEGATQRFARVQAAYECLSDEQERAWYDDHREDIASGGGASEADASFFDQLRRGQRKAPEPTKRATPARGMQTQHLMQFFSASAWGAFDDSPTGFYNTFSTLFSLLSADEVQWSSPYLYPSFGTSSTTSPEDLRAFYSTWQNFSTEKDFAWLDQYRVEESMPRWQRRDIEKENGRGRSQGKREYNETVRNLVLFVRRRDPRYSPTDSSASRALAAQQIKTSLAAAAALAAAEREANAAKYAAQAWQEVGEKEESAARMWEEVSEEGGEGEEGEGGEEDGEGVERIEWCEACEKGFRSGGAWENHERSRKHQKNVERLIREMQAEDAALGLSQPHAQPSQSHPSATASSSSDLSDDGEEPLVASSSRPASPSPVSTAADDERAAAALADSLASFSVPSPAPTPNNDSDDGFAAVGMATKAKRKKAKGKEKGKGKKGFPASPFELDFDAEEEEVVGEEEETPPPAALDSSDDDWRGGGGGKGKKGKGKKAAGRKGKQGGTGTGTAWPAVVASPAVEKEEVQAEEREGEEVVAVAVAEKKEKKGKGKGQEKAVGEEREEKEDDEDGEEEDGKEMSKKEKRRLKDALKQKGAGEELRCNVCSTAFPSRTKLFNHITETGHALAAGQGQGQGDGGGGKGKKKGKR